MYAKTGAKNSKHEPVSETTNVTALSKIAVQVFEHIGHGCHFTSITTTTALLNTYHFHLLPSFQLLTLIHPHPSAVNADGLDLSSTDMEVFSDLQSPRNLVALKNALEAFKK